MGISEKKVSAPDIDGPVASVSYAPFQGATHADQAQTSVAQIRSDLRMLSRHTRAVRTYSSTGGVELVPPIAAEFGAEGHRRRLARHQYTERNEREIALACIELARRNSNVHGVVVGNEAIVCAAKSSLLGNETLTPEENEQIAAGAHSCRAGRRSKKRSTSRA